VTQQTIHCKNNREENRSPTVKNNSIKNHWITSEFVQKYPGKAHRELSYFDLIV
jgi:hypothetical protein